MEHAHFTGRATRDWRGFNHHVSACSTEELFSLLTNAVTTTNQVARFIADVQLELVLRGEIPADPYSVE